MEIDIRDYMKRLTRKSWLIVVVIAIGLAVAHWAQTQFAQPVYRATAVLILNHPSEQDSDSKASNFDSVRTNLMLIQTYRDILTSHKVLDELIHRQPELNLSRNELLHKLHVITMPESQVVTLHVHDGEYERAALIANTLTTVFAETVSGLFQLDNVEILSEADRNAPTAPLNQNGNLYIIAAFIASALLGIGIVTLLEYMNDTFRREVEIERFLGIPVIAQVPTIRKKDSELQSVYVQQAGDQKHVSIQP